MKIDGKSIPKPKAIAEYEGSMGKVLLFDLSARYAETLWQYLEDPVSTGEASEFTRRLLCFTCYPCVGEKAEQEGTLPDGPVFSLADTEKWPEKEVEELASLFITHSNLNRSLMQKQRSDKEGKKVTFFEYGEVEHQKKEEETNAQYLQRLCFLRKKECLDQMQELRKSIGSLVDKAGFPSNLAADIAKTISLGDSVNKIAEDMRNTAIFDSMKKPFDRLSAIYPHVADTHSVKATLTPLEYPLPQIDFESIDKNRKAPFEALGRSIEESVGSRLDQIMELSSQSLSFASRTNEIQTGMQSVIQASSKAASDTSAKNLLLTKVVIAMTVIGILVTALTPLMQSMGDERSARQNVEILKEELVNINGTVSNAVAASETSLKATLEAIRLNRVNEQEIYDKILAEQAQIISIIERKQSVDQQAITELKEQLASLQEKYDKLMQDKGSGSVAQKASDKE